jgi:hypothetical protein
VAAEGAAFGDAVLVLQHDELDTLSGLDGAADSAESLRLGRTPGP